MKALTLNITIGKFILWKYIWLLPIPCLSKKISNKVKLHFHFYSFIFFFNLVLCKTMVSKKGKLYEYHRAGEIIPLRMNQS